MNRKAIRNKISRMMFQITGRKPWSRGYIEYKWWNIQQALQDAEMVASFGASVLPQGFGQRIDERIVEYSWIFHHLPAGKYRLLDAGSVLNFKEIVPHVAGKDLTIFTLAPESQCYWRRGISYQFGDLREMPFRDSWFDVVVCASTLEHVGMNNVNYDGRQHTLVEDDFVHAAQEILRVTRKGGTILITVPFGKRQLLKWNDAVFARQFDSLLLRQLADVFGSSLREIEFFQYDPDGWKKSHEAACQDVSYFNIHEQQHYDDDLAAAARSVACLRIVK